MYLELPWQEGGKAVVEVVASSPRQPTDQSRFVAGRNIKWQLWRMVDYACVGLADVSRSLFLGLPFELTDDPEMAGRLILEL